MTDSQSSILVIDDEERVRELMLEFLSEFDEFSLKGAASGEEALEVLRQNPADVCVVDLRLPGMDGSRFIELAAADSLCGKFIVHTGSVDFVLPERLLGLGMVSADVFYKPVDTMDIVERIQVLLKTGAAGG